MSDSDYTTPDSMNVEPGMIISAFEQVSEQGPKDAFDLLSEREPALASWVRHKLVFTAGEMTMSGVQQDVIHHCYADSIVLVATLVEAIQQGHTAIWDESVKGTPIEELLTPEPPEQDDRQNDKDGDCADCEDGVQ